MKGATNGLKSRAIHQILHSPIKPLTAENIYYVVVLTDNDYQLYTSSYTGAYDIMMGRLKNKGDEH